MGYINLQNGVIRFPDELTPENFTLSTAGTSRLLGRKLVNGGKLYTQRQIFSVSCEYDMLLNCVVIVQGFG